MNKLYRKLAFQNLLKNGKAYIPYMVAQGLMVALFYNMLFLAGNQKILLLPGGANIQSTLSYGALVMAMFAMIFLFYVNSFLMKQRKSEFGIYRVLGMENRHLKKVIFYETGIACVTSFGIGMLSGILFSGLLYMILLNILGARAALSFGVSGSAVRITFFLFFFLFLLVLFYNFLQLRKVNPRELLQGSVQGEREPRARKGMVVLGIICLLIGYGIALLVRNVFASLFLFFVAVVFVIIGTYALFTAGSIALLKRIKADESRYYTPRFFSAVSGLLYRMKQNAAGLAGICVLSTMILVTCSVSVSVYCGQETAIRKNFPTDIVVTIVGSTNPDQDLQYVRAQAEEAAKQTGIPVKEVTFGEERNEELDTGMGEMQKRILISLEGTDKQKNDCSELLKLNGEDGQHTYQTAYFFCKQSPNEGAQAYRSMYGGLLFLGIFLGAMFMTATVLMIYYKQVSEGYDDRQRYQIMKKVGMSDQEVKSTIKSQVLMVFFMPLLMAAIHTLAALPSMIRICKIMSIGGGVVSLCTVGTVIVFALFYIGVYGQTAKAYYTMVNQEQA